MLSDKAVYRTLLQALSVLGKSNADLVMKALEEQNVIQSEKVDLKRLEPVLKSIFGEGARVILEPAIRAKIIE